MTADIDSSALSGLVKVLERRSTRFWAGAAIAVALGGVAVATGLGMLMGGTGGLIALSVAVFFALAALVLAGVVIRLARVVADTRARQALEAVDDDLTGLSNRRHFLELVEREFARCRRYGDDGALLLIDADHLRRINEHLGQLCGDALLLEVTKRVGTTLRQPDLLARFGGAELAVLEPDPCRGHRQHRRGHRPPGPAERRHHGARGRAGARSGQGGRAQLRAHRADQAAQERRARVDLSVAPSREDRCHRMGASGFFMAVRGGAQALHPRVFVHAWRRRPRPVILRAGAGSAPWVPAGVHAPDESGSGCQAWSSVPCPARARRCAASICRVRNQRRPNRSAAMTAPTSIRPPKTRQISGTDDVRFAISASWTARGEASKSGSSPMAMRVARAAFSAGSSEGMAIHSTVISRGVQSCDGVGQRGVATTCRKHLNSSGSAPGCERRKREECRLGLKTSTTPRAR
ncbi:MAG: GGDEF domain-containing protein [Burkholderiales bacterium]|nr:GGDEF domain-containing protein [Burkholderiales bacterium]